MKPKIGVMLGAVFASLVFPAVARSQLTGNLTVEVQGLRNQQGKICFKIFNGSQGFPNNNDRAVRRECVVIAESLPEDPDQPLTTTFENLESGTYAIALYHDSNGDEQLNRDGLGIPAEGYGFSNNAPAVTGPPNYADAAFVLIGSDSTVQIQMRYP
ncbi:MAG: DUF2141 domain-containing protein [Cyanobacteriota bacterium]